MQPNQESQPQITNEKVEQKENNFRLLEAKYERLLAKEREAREELERKVQEKARPQEDDDEEDSDPYIDRRKLNKELSKFGQQAKQQTQTDIQRAVHTAIQEERKQGWLKNNSDFYDVLQHAEKFATHDPELAETILSMPEGFERQKLVYKSIKALGLHENKPKQSDVQDKINKNQRTPYYQPSSVGTAPYASQGDFSASGQKNAYQQMQELKSRLRL